MPAPYSDNLYSADDSDLDVTDDDDLDVHLSPTDGYFHGTSSSSAANLYPPQQQEQENHHVTDATPLPTSAGVPYVPNVLVQDPSLQQQGASQKDREAREETSLLNSSSALSPPETSSPSAASAPAAVQHHHYDVDDDGASTSGYIEPTPSHTTYTSNALGSSSYTPYSPSVDAPLRTPQTHSRRSPYSHSASLFSIPREAPPAYTPSPTSPLSSSPTAHRNYQTISSTMGVPEEGRRLLGRDPESMGDEPYYNDPRPPRRLRDRVLKKFPWATRRTLKTVLLAALVLTALSAFVGILATNIFRAPSNPPPAQPGFEPGLPIKDGPKAPTDPSQPVQPPSQPAQPPSRLLPWNPQSSCLRTEHRFETKVFDLSFKPDKTISVLQSVNTDVPHRGYQPQVSGSFVVRRQLSDAPGPSVEVQVVGNDERLAVDMEWDADSQQLKIKAPQYIEWNQALRPCMAIRATVWVPENAELRTLQLAALDLDVQLGDDLALTVMDGVEIRTYAGDVSSPAQPPASYKLDSRNIVVQTISGDIAGTWPLYDSLKVGSDSGDIGVSVKPQPVLESKPLPAVLNIATISGDITVREPLSKALKTSKPDTVIPPRDYVTDIDTKSGTVRAWVTFSSVAVLSTISGDISGAILPVYNISLLRSVPEPELHTKTKSGAVTLAILEPMWVEIASTLSGGGEKTLPPADPNQPVDIPTNPVPLPVPVPAIPAVPIKIPRMLEVPSVPFMPIDVREPSGTHLSSEKRSVAVSEQQARADSSSSSRSGSSNLAPAAAAAAGTETLPMRHLKSSHTSISGDLKLSYPGSWEGMVEAESISGNINIGGDGVHIESKTQWPKTVRAVKGDRWACSASVSTASGNTNLYVGR